MLASLVAGLLLGPSAAPVNLGRTFKLGEKLAYKVHSTIHIEQKLKGLDTAVPQDLDLSYGFTTEVTQLKPDGIAVIHYLRPTFTEVRGETFNSPPKTTVDKANLDFQLTVSPINEILGMKDLTKKKKGGAGDLGFSILAFAGARQGGAEAIGRFISEIYRLSLFVGSFDSALDFAPRMSLDDVNVGDTWRKTVGYQPQSLKGKEGKQAVQRLDYVYTYRGPMVSEGRKIERVDADLDLSTDLAPFVNQAEDATAEETGLSKLPLKIKAHIAFDLDPVTHRTILAQANTDGGFEIWATDSTDEAIIQQTIKGETAMRLIGVGKAPTVGKSH